MANINDIDLLFTSKQLRQFLINQDSLGDAIYRCNDREILKHCQHEIECFVDHLGTEFSKVEKDGEINWVTDTGVSVSNDHALENLIPVFK